MRRLLPIALMLFFLSACGPASHQARAEPRDELNLSSSACSILLGKYKITRDNESDYFAYLEIKSGGVDFEIGVLDHYQPLIAKAVPFTCEGTNKIVFRFDDDYGNKAVAAFTKSSDGYSVDLSLVGTYRDDIGTSNVRRNYARYALDIDRSK